MEPTNIQHQKAKVKLNQQNYCSQQSGAPDNILYPRPKPLFVVGFLIRFR